MPAAIGASDFGAHSVGIQAFVNCAGNFIIKRLGQPQVDSNLLLEL